MSGIVGILNLDGAPVERSLLGRLTARIAFRGPDAQAIRIHEHVGFAHTLLRATFESAHEQQPFSFDENAMIVADARLDARQELTQELIRRGRSVLHDAPDVELILHAYIVWGEACVDYLAGDFVFAIWDARKQKLFCARDQLGVKPFFYARVANTFAFSNTLGALRLFPGVTKRLNEQAIGDFLLFGMNQEWETTTFADISRLPPAHVLFADRDGIKTRRYWELRVPQRDLKIRDNAEYTQEFRAIFERAIADRLRTTRVGAHLSGGMDSTSVALLTQRALQAKGAPFDLRTYAIGFNEIIPDREADLAQETADAAGLHLERLEGKDFYSLARLPDSAFLSDEPTAIPALEPLAEINRRISAFRGTLFAGYGGDPLLYPSRTFLRECVARGEWRVLFHALRENWRLNGKLPPFYLKSAFLKKEQQLPPMPARHWLNPFFATRLELDSRWREIQLRNQSANQWRLLAASPFWSNLFTFWDSTSTGLPLEVQFPFCDLRLIDFVGRIPPVPWLEKKRLLRAAMYDIVPQPILKRPKTPLGGFPFHSWVVKHGAPAWLKELIDLPLLAEFTEPAQLHEMTSAPESYPPGVFSRILSTLTLAYWFSRGQP